MLIFWYQGLGDRNRLLFVKAWVTLEGELFVSWFLITSGDKSEKACILLQIILFQSFNNTQFMYNNPQLQSYLPKNSQFSFPTFLPKISISELQPNCYFYFNILKLTIISNMQKLMMQFQLKHGTTGHSQKIYLQGYFKGEALFNQIYSMYKINHKDQLLLTKLGEIIKNTDDLLSKFNNQTQHSLDDKTFSKSFSRNQPSSRKINCIYLFDMKDLNKKEDSPTNQSQWIQNLNEKLQNMDQLKSTIFTLEDLKVHFSQYDLGKYEKFFNRVNSIKESYKRLANQYSGLKQSIFKLEQTIQRCLNQKKFAMVLMKQLHHQFTTHVKSINEAQSIHSKLIKQKMKGSLQQSDKSLRENSNFFQNRKKEQSSFISFQNEIKQLKLKMSNLKQQCRHKKNIFKLCDISMMNYGGLSIKQNIEKRNHQHKNNYDQIIGLFRQLLNAGTSDAAQKIIGVFDQKLKFLEDNIMNCLAPEFQDWCQKITDNYANFNKFHENNKKSVIQIVLWYLNTKKALGTYLHQLSKDIQYNIKLCSDGIEQERSQNSLNSNNSNISKQNEDKLSKNNSFIIKKSKDQIQIIRRMKFRKTLNFIQSFATKICQLEEQQRKKYINDVKNGHKCQFQSIKNYNVPQIDIDDSKTSDLELLKLVKSSKIEISQPQLNLEEFVFLNYNNILQKVKLLTNNDTNIKIKNMQEILKKVTDIFAKIYNNKVDQCINQKQRVIQKNQGLQQKLQQLNTQFQDQKTKIIELEKKLIEKQQFLINRQKQRCEQMKKQRSQKDKIQSQLRSVQKDLVKQIAMNEELYKGFIELDQTSKNQNRDFKEIIAQKELQIIQLQKKIIDHQERSLQNSKSIVGQPQQNELKMAVFHNFSKDIKQTTQKDSQIQRLNIQIQLLQRENQQLQEQIQQLSTQLRKIITRETQDVQTQVCLLNQQHKSPKQINRDEIKIQQDICIGQNAIFMPFSGSVYVGVCNKDDDRTICNMNSNHHNTYILDLASFKPKVKELLAQCSFLVVLNVTNIETEGKDYIVRGSIKHLLGFEDESTILKNYASFIRN